MGDDRRHIGADRSGSTVDNHQLLEEQQDMLAAQDRHLDDILKGVTRLSVLGYAFGGRLVWHIDARDVLVHNHLPMRCRGVMCPAYDVQHQQRHSFGVGCAH